MALFTVSVSSDTGAEETSVSDELNSARRKEVVAQMKKILEQTTIIRKKAMPVEVELVPRPVLLWDDVPRGHHYGTLWIWGPKGRPAAIVEMYTVGFAKDIERWPGNVLHSLAPEPLEGKSRFNWEWAPSEPGFIPKPLDRAPTPATTKSGRELQMRALAKRFSGNQTWMGDREQLRLLTTPVWQYEAGDDGVSTGGLFVFTHGGTNPEVVLILEATRHNDDEHWSFGCVRLGHAEMEVTFDESKVWSVPVYNQVNPKSPYYWIAKP
ncbi:MAG TPA: hypothetical protein VGM05_06920 [Planctomycetaceae bacterium]|jgi:hypothetical protein